MASSSSFSSLSSASSLSPVFEDAELISIPARALNVSSRIALSRFLNSEQALPSTQGIARDYRGLAEQMGFEYNDIKNFRRSEDPTLKVLEAWEGKPSSTIGLLMEYLENMERHDVLEDVSPQFKNDAVAYVRRIQKTEFPIQVPEVTSCRPLEFQAENPNAMTVDDVVYGNSTGYDAYVCYAEEDIAFVYELAKYLESPRIGMKLFIKDRNQLSGTQEIDNNTKLIRERCNRMLIILSPEFLKSPECEFQTSFAAGLAIEQRKRMLIPIIISPCELPLILKYVSKIDFTKPLIPEWLWNKLIQSIRGTPSSVFVSPPVCMPQSRLLLGNGHPMLGFSAPTNPIITFPPTINFSQVTPNTQLTSSEVIAENVEPTSSYRLQAATSATSPKTTPPQKQKWYHSIKERFASLNSSTSTTHASSTATSGYHSRSSIGIDSSDETEVQNCYHEATV